MLEFEMGGERCGMNGLLSTSDAAADLRGGGIGGRRIAHRDDDA